MSEWIVDKKNGIARFGQTAEMNANGTGRLRLSMENGVLLAAEQDADAASTEGFRLDGGFLFRPFRMLSAVLVDGYWLDFTDAKMLEKATPLFGGVTIFTNHRPDVNDWIGVTQSPRFTQSKGVPGIDAEFKIDATDFPRIAKGLQLDPPAIKANSVGLTFTANRSHPDMGSEFWSNLGREVDGQVVRFIVTSIKRVLETSLVYAGADPYAGALSAPDRQFFISSNDTEKPMPTEHHAEDLQASLTSLQEELKEKDTALKSYTELGTVEEFKALRSEQASALKAVRDRALAVYLSLEGEKANDTMKGIIESASFEQATALHADFQQKLEERHPLSCPSCGKAGLTRASSERPAPPEGSSSSVDRADQVDVSTVKMSAKNGAR